MPMQDKVSTGKRAKIPLQAKALMAAVAVITLVAVWLVPDDKQPTPPPLPELPLSLIHISEPTRLVHSSRMPSSA